MILRSIQKTNVDQFVQTETDIIYAQGTSLYKSGILEDKPTLLFEGSEEEEGFQEIYLHNTLIYTNDIHGNGVLITDKGAEFLTGFTIVNVISETELLCNHDKKTVIYNIESKTSKVVLPVKCFKFKYNIDSDVLFYVENYNVIKAYNITTAELIWEFDVSELAKYIPPFKKEYKLGEIYKIAGVYKNQLIFTATSNKVIGLNKNDGELLWVKDTLDSETKDENSLKATVIGRDLILDSKNGCLYSFYGNFFITLNIETQNAKVIWDTNKDFTFRGTKKFDSSKILFRAWRRENIGNDDTIGLFDIKEKVVTWQHVMDFRKGGFIPASFTCVHLSETHLSVLDFEKTLHIFEHSGF